MKTVQFIFAGIILTSSMTGKAMPMESLCSEYVKAALQLRIEREILESLFTDELFPITEEQTFGDHKKPTYQTDELIYPSHFSLNKSQYHMIRVRDFILNIKNKPGEK